MADCCEDKACAIDVLRERQGGTLRIVLAINAGMFLIVLAAGLVAGSSALLADSLDNLGDALTYALSLYAVARTARTKARVALFKGFLILAAGIFVVGQVVYKLLHPAVPIFEAMGMIAILALVANGACLALLWKHRHEDVNMSSVWECSRNDIASNLAVLVAAAGVWLTATQWPDLVVGALLAGLFLASGARVLRSALKASRDSGQPVTIRLAR
jgi:Co/Zn/Cd efflux system component